MRDLDVCRRLCLSLEPADLKVRLSTSRWSPKKDLVAKMVGGEVLDDRWLDEASAAFQVSLWTGKK